MQDFCKKTGKKFANPKKLPTFAIPNRYAGKGKRGISSVGRAFEWHSKGQEFDSPMLHEKSSAKMPGFFVQHTAVYPPRFALPPRGRLGATPRPPPITCMPLSARTGPFFGPVRAFSAIFARTGPTSGPVRALHYDSLAVVNKGTVVCRRIFGFQRARAGGNGRARRDDGVCLTTVTGPWDRKREESAVKAISDLWRAAERRMEPAHHRPH